MDIVLLFLGPDWSLFEYDPNVKSITWGGLLLGTISPNGDLGFPLLEGGLGSGFAKDLIHGLTLDDLRKAAKITRTVNLESRGTTYAKAAD